MSSQNQTLYSDGSSPALDSGTIISSRDPVGGQSQSYRKNPLEYKAFFTPQLNIQNNYSLDLKNIEPTTTNLEHYRKKQKIKQFLKQSTKEMIFPNADYLACEASVTNSLLILEHLDDSYDLPKIAIDEDGVIIFVWEKTDKTCLLTFEKDLLHFYSHNNQGITLERLDGEQFSKDKFFSKISPKVF